MTCRECQYWTRGQAHEYDGICDRWSRPGAAFEVDPGDWAASSGRLLTLATFGCNQFEAKDAVR